MDNVTLQYGKNVMTVRGAHYHYHLSSSLEQYVQTSRLLKQFVSVVEEYMVK